MPTFTFPANQINISMQATGWLAGRGETLLQPYLPEFNISFHSVAVTGPDVVVSEKVLTQ